MKSELLNGMALLSNLWKNSFHSRNSKSLQFFLLIFFLTPCYRAANVTIIQSTDDPFYNDALAGIKETFSAETQFVNLDQCSDQMSSTVKKIKSKNPRVVVVIGPPVLMLLSINPFKLQAKVSSAVMKDMWAHGLKIHPLRGPSYEGRQAGREAQWQEQPPSNSKHPGKATGENVIRWNVYFN